MCSSWRIVAGVGVVGEGMGLALCKTLKASSVWRKRANCCWW